MSRRIGYNRKLGGKTFTLGGFRSKKSNAQKAAQSIRTTRYRKVRTIKAKGGWAIFER